ncbi:MAG: peptide deformylase [Pseudorhodobacter sp.]|jgi:peptide deformylase
MAVLPILQWPDALLATVCTAVGPDEDVSRLVVDMLDTMYDAPGRGLAAPQLGVLKRFFVMDVTWKEGKPAPFICINPVIEAMSDTRATGPEGCLSIPDTTTQIERATTITLRWRDLSGAVLRQELTGFAAICAQHEFDHLDGRVTFDRLPPLARAAALAEYAA